MKEPIKRPVLIADDLLSSRAILKKVFGEDYEVLEAVNGREALGLLHARPDIAVVLLDIFMPEVDGFGVLSAMQQDEALKNIPVVVMTASTDEETQMKALSSGAMDVLYKPINPLVTRRRVTNLIAGMDSVRLFEHNRVIERELQKAEIDVVSGIFNKNTFLRRAAQYLKEHPDGDYILMRWDMDNFKVYNDVFDSAAGDDYLRKVGDYYRANGSKLPGMILYARYEADHFVCLRDAGCFDAKKAAHMLDDLVQKGKTRRFDYTTRIGLYRIVNPSMDVALMCDRALLALQSIKNTYGNRYAWYQSSMRDRLVQEHEIINEMKSALQDGQFQVYFQPQYNYTAGTLTGAEALVRWIHPKKGVISPSLFIPIFEKNGFIYELDRYIWEQACFYLKRWKELGIHTPSVSVSVNISRKDIHQPDIVERICALLDQYGIQPPELHLEITESAYIDNPKQVEPVVSTLRKQGFHVEMDDFGSGYSSLNTLKDVPVDMLKLDLQFLTRGTDGGKSGKILSAIVRMAHEIDLPVIAEGVETKQQADFLKSIGCHYMQGFYFSRPIPVGEFEALLRAASVERIVFPHSISKTDSSVDFMDANTQSTLLFNSFVGGAAILEYRADKLTPLRLNDRFFEEIKVDRQAYTKAQANLLERFTPKSRGDAITALEKAASTGEESECELCALPFQDGGGNRWTKCRFRCLSQGVDSTLFYVSLDDITTQKALQTELKKAYRDLSMNTELYCKILDETENILIVAERHTKELLYVNAAAAKLAERAKEASAGTSCQAYFQKLSPLCAHCPENDLQDRPLYHEADFDGKHYALRITPINWNGRDAYIEYIADRTEAWNKQKYTDEILENMPGGVALFHLEHGQCIRKYLSQGAFAALGYETGEIPESNLNANFERVYADDLKKLREAVATASVRREPFTMDMRIHMRSGKPRWVNLTASPAQGGSDRLLYYGLYTDITDRKRMEEELRIREQEYVMATRQSGINVYRYNLENRTGYFCGTEGDASGTPAEIPDLPEYAIRNGIIAPESVDDWQSLFDDIEQGIPDGGADIRCKDMRGSFHWLRLRYSLFYSDEGTPSAAVISYHDITKETEKLMRIQQQADTDGMTGVLNHAAAERAVSELLSIGTERSNAFLLLDLDNLKRINDIYGHLQGDRALISIARTLKKRFRGTDVIGRVGGDEFVVLLPGMKHEATLRATLDVLLREIGSLTAGEHDEVSIHCSIGCTFCNGGEDDFKSAYRRADQALYQVKRNGKNGYSFYSEDMGSIREHADDTLHD